MRADAYVPLATEGVAIMAMMGSSQGRETVARRIVAALLSVIVPGCGLFVRGRVKAGLFVFLGVPAIALTAFVIIAAVPEESVLGTVALLVGAGTALALYVWGIVASARARNPALGPAAAQPHARVSLSAVPQTEVAPAEPETRVPPAAHAAASARGHKIWRYARHVLVVSALEIGGIAAGVAGYEALADLLMMSGVGYVCFSFYNWLEARMGAHPPAEDVGAEGTAAGTVQPSADYLPIERMWGDARPAISFRAFGAWMLVALIGWLILPLALLTICEQLGAEQLIAPAMTVLIGLWWLLLIVVVALYIHRVNTHSADRSSRMLARIVVYLYAVPLLVSGVWWIVMALSGSISLALALLGTLGGGVLCVALVGLAHLLTRGSEYAPALPVDVYRRQRRWWPHNPSPSQ